MRKLCLSLGVLGLGGLGVLLLTEKGRRGLLWTYQNLHRGPGKLLEWNQAAQREMDRIQSALDRVAKSLPPTRA